MSIRRPLPENAGKTVPLWKIAKTCGIKPYSCWQYINRLKLPYYSVQPGYDRNARIVRVLLEEDAKRFLEWFTSDPRRLARMRAREEAREAIAAAK